MRERRRQGQTTTNTASQVLDDGGNFGGEDFTLPNDAVTIIDVQLVGKRNGFADAVVAILLGRFFRDAGGNCMRVGTDSNDTQTTAALAGTTADLNINGTQVELRVSPSGNTPIDWRWTRKQFEGAS